MYVMLLPVERKARSTAENCLEVYDDEGQTELNFETESLSLDTSELVERFSQTEQITGICVPIYGTYEAYGSWINGYLVLEEEKDDKFRSIRLLV